MSKKYSDGLDVTKGSGNVFADIGSKNPEEKLAKAKLCLYLHQILKKRKLTQSEAAKILGIAQPRLSEIIRGKVSDYTIDRVLHYITVLDHDVVINLKPKSGNRKQGKIMVAVG